MDDVSTPSGSGLVEVNPPIGFFRAPWQLVRSLRQHWPLVSNFVQRDIRLKYRDTTLGYVWSLLEPLLLSAVYYFLFVVIAGKPDEKHVVVVLLGVITWQFFAKATTSSLTCLTRNEAMIKQVYFPRELFAVTSVASQLVMTALSLLVAIPLMIYFGIAPTVNLALVPLGLILVGILSLGLGLGFACLNVVNRDVEYVFRFVTRAGMFVSPVMWTLSMVPPNRQGLVSVVLYNPLSLPISMVRDGVLGEPLGIDAAHVAFSVGFCLASLLIGLMIFKRGEAQVVKKL